MEVRVEEMQPGCYIMRPKGDVDMSTSPALRETMRKHLKPGTRSLLLELSEVPYMDSSGIATLVEALQLSQRHGIRFALASLAPSVQAAFEVAHLIEVFHIVRDSSWLLEEGD